MRLTAAEALKAIVTQHEPDDIYLFLNDLKRVNKKIRNFKDLGLM